MRKYKFTIFTPCYNSEKFLDRVYESVNAQTFRDFEWLIINDCSTDRTDEIIKGYIKEATFPVKYISNKKNMMLSNNFNIAFDNSEGELILLAGHDDSFKHTTLEKLDNVWNRYSNVNTSGIWSLCEDQYGNLIGNAFEKQVEVGTYFEKFKKYIFRKERFVCVKTEVARQYKFDTASLDYIPEDVLWGRIGLKYETIFYNEVLRTYYINENENALTNRSRSKVVQSVIFQYKVWLNEFLVANNIGVVLFLRFHFGYLFYNLMNKNGWKKLLDEIDSKRSRIILISFFPFAYALLIVLKITKRL